VPGIQRRANAPLRLLRGIAMSDQHEAFSDLNELGMDQDWDQLLSVEEQSYEDGKIVGHGDGYDEGYAEGKAEGRTQGFCRACLMFTIGYPILKVIEVLLLR
jgi:hypothetical protein